jgi:C-terminal processing protease CtpA/Prc
MAVAPIPRELRLHYGAPPGSGVLVTSVDPEGDAARAKIEVGDVLVSIDGTPMHESSDVPRALMASRDPSSVRVSLVRDRKNVEARISVAMRMQREQEARALEEQDAAALYRLFGTPAPDPDAERIRVLEQEIERLMERLAAVEEELRQVKKEP